MSVSKKNKAIYSFQIMVRDTMRAMGLELGRYHRRGAENLPLYLDPDFGDLYKKYHAQTMIPWQGLYAAYGAAKHVAQNKIPGAIVECGVWKGGCIAIMAETLAHFGDTLDREFFLYDTFAGMAEPGEADSHISGQLHARDIYQNNAKEGQDHVDWCYGSHEGVAELVKTLPQKTEKFHLVRGLVEETIPETLPAEIALLRLDTDWYDSTLHELEYMFPLLHVGGFLLVDDYGSWAGSKKAVDEYFVKNKLHERMFLNAVHGHGSIIGQLFPKNKKG